MDLPIQLPNTIWSWIAVIAAIIAAYVYIRQQSIKGLKDDLDSLRNRLDDKDKEIKDLQIDLKNQSDANTAMQSEIKELQRQNKTKDDLIVTALKQFFFENPKMASSMESILPTR